VKTKKKEHVQHGEITGHDDPMELTRGDAWGRSSTVWKNKTGAVHREKIGRCPIKGTDGVSSHALGSLAAKGTKGAERFEKVQNTRSRVVKRIGASTGTGSRHFGGGYYNRRKCGREQEGITRSIIRNSPSGKVGVVIPNST